MSANSTTIMAEMFYDSRQGFSRLDGRPALWLPLLAVTLGTALMYYWYFATVDFDWLISHTLAASPDLTDSQRDTARGMMTLSMMSWTTVGMTILLTPLTFAMFAVYYLMAGRFLGCEIGYARWFAFCVWTSVPRLLVLPLMALQIVTSHGQVALEDLSMVSLNALLLHLPNSSPWAGLASGIDLTIGWSCVLAVSGLRVWTRRSYAACTFIVLLPLVTLYGLWALKIAMFS